jgi:Fe-S-cluster containining protein
MVEAAWQQDALDALVTEYEAATADAAVDAPVTATRRHYARYEIRLAAMDAASPVACASGCAHCCHLRVSVRANEALHLAAIVQALPAEAGRALHAGLARNAQRVRAMPVEQHMKTPLRCAFLGEDDTCGIYEHRPSACRRYHSRSAAACKTSFEQPDDLSSRIAISSQRVVAGVALELAYRKVLEEGRRDTRAYELNTALVEALADPAGCRERWSHAERTFEHALPGEVPEDIASA